MLQRILAPSGVRFNGSAPWDIQVHDSETYRRILAQGSLGFGEAYVDGLWDCTALDEFFCRLMRADVDQRMEARQRIALFWHSLRSHLVNLQSPHRAFEVGQRHYDIGNDIFEAMLDRPGTGPAGQVGPHLPQVAVEGGRATPGYRLRDKYGTRFYRMWRYYLQTCAGFFHSRQGQLWQLVLGKGDRRDVYRPERWLP